ncbi:transglutaminase family protein [Hufsiella ginkgonis]|uniref:Transglutaminase family protein n=1 Tax=Hufsiella ginkgonis TaxID=2695274 RepID=A0A7K1Y5H0_9SPHI|nr:transglutaminase family protein [Hufsiella ginkgonis]MXV17946.1 transglutaminase family protein [Hufsiella ginkgonis]
MPKFKIQHLTTYSYQGTVRDSANKIMLYPVADAHQDILNQELLITGDPMIDIYTDYYGNQVGSFTHSEPHSEMRIDSRLLVTTAPIPLPVDDMFAGQQWQDLDNLRWQVPYIDYLKQEYFTGLQELKEIVLAERQFNHTPYQAAMHYCKYVYENFRYIQGVTSVESTLDDIWQLKAGVCQDFAHILLVMLRLVNIPSRYVSGYICPNKNGMRGEGATHAWAEAYIPNYGWLGLDPTNNCAAGETHVKLAVGRNFSDCSPIKGVYKGALDHTLHVSVIVSYEDGTSTEELPAETIIARPVSEFAKNSYMRHMAVLQQQQQQQQ